MKCEEGSRVKASNPNTECLLSDIQMSETEISGSDNRRRQPKSKNGCRVCKKRRVKCDELRPACRNCLKYGAHCDYAAASKACIPLLSVPSKISCFGGLDSGFSIDVLELFHHYHTSTCFTFTTEPLVRSFWQLVAPYIGFSNPYILRGMLAITALHISKFRKEREGFFLTQAFLHHRAGLEMAQPVFVDITADNCEQLFVFSILSKVFALAKPKGDSDWLLAREKSVPEWLGQFRSLHEYVSGRKETGQLSFTAALFEDSMHPPVDFWLAYSSEKDALDELEANIYTSANKDLNVLAAILDALRHLQESFVIFNESAFSGKSQAEGVLTWLRTINDAYIALVAEGNNEALCILSFYCVLLRRLDYLWWIEGWGLYLIERIHRQLPYKFRSWIRWPIQEIGWVP